MMTSALPGTDSCALAVRSMRRIFWTSSPSSVPRLHLVSSVSFVLEFPVRVLLVRQLPPASQDRIRMGTRDARSDPHEGLYEPERRKKRILTFRRFQDCCTKFGIPT